MNKLYRDIWYSYRLTGAAYPTDSYSSDILNGMELGVFDGDTYLFCTY